MSKTAVATHVDHHHQGKTIDSFIVKAFWEPKKATLQIQPIINSSFRISGLTVGEEGVSEVQRPHQAGEGVVWGASLDLPLHGCQLHFCQLRLQTSVGLLQLRGGGVWRERKREEEREMGDEGEGRRRVRWGERPWQVARYLCGIVDVVFPQRHSATPDSPEGLAEGFLYALHSGQGTFHGQLVTGVERAPGNHSEHYWLLFLSLFSLTIKIPIKQIE